MITKYEALAGGIAAMLAALVYILRLLRRMAAGIDFWTSLPSGYQQLTAATKANTEAIARLTTRLDDMEQVPVRRRPR